MADTTVIAAPPATRLSLRAPATSRRHLSALLGLPLPEAPGGSSQAGARTALWLGPDEWLVLDETMADIAALCAATRVLHSAVDISDRDIGLIVEGSHAEMVLAAGCPLDLSGGRFAVGRATRTLFGKAGMVLWRTGEQSFRLEFSRSFEAYAQALLARSIMLAPAR